MKQILYVILLLCFCIAVRAQNNEFKSLQLNSCPAYVILAVDPENIQRPNSPTTFVSSVQSAIVSGRLQPNFAMETSPYYWARKKPGDITRKYSAMHFILDNNYWNNLARSVTLSFATSPTDSFNFGNTGQGTGLGAGFHLQLVQGHYSKKTRDNLLLLHHALNEELVWTALRSKLRHTDSVAWADYLDDYFVAHPEMLSMDQDIIRMRFRKQLRRSVLTINDTAYISRAVKEIEYVQDSSAFYLTQNKIPLTREGFMLELAFADALIAEDSRWNRLTNAKAAVWLTPSYRFNTSTDPAMIDFVDLMAVARIVFNSQVVDSSDYFDAGVKLQWTHNNLSFSGESIYRRLSQKPETRDKAYTWRADLSISYKISDAITFKATFGSNFDGTATHYSDPEKMFAVGGFNFGFSDFSKKEN